MGLLDRFSKKQQKEKLTRLGKKEQEKLVHKTTSRDEKTPEASPKQTNEVHARHKEPIAYRVLIRPHVTEKASMIAKHNQYVFLVQPDANKQQIKQAIEEVYRVHPIAIRIAHIPGKKVRFGRHQGSRKDWKKAMITLKSGETVPTETA